MAEQVPSVGRVVHFVYGDRHVPAIIIDPDYHTISIANPSETHSSQLLQVFTADIGPFTTTADFDPTGASATWHWPEYVPAKGA